MTQSVSDLQFEFFLSKFHIIREIKNSERNNVKLVFYEPYQVTAVLKQYYGRDLCGIYNTLKQLPHKNLVVVYETLYYKGDTYILEEYLEGETLADRIRNNKYFSEQETVEIMLAVCDGLEILHKQIPPMIHRDIKPSNIIIKRDGQVKLIDYDTVREYKSESANDTICMGTKEYASPEHYGYGQTSCASDIYSLGVTMHEMLTGELVFNQKIIYKGKLRNVIESCLQVDKKQRMQNIRELELALTDCIRKRRKNHNKYKIIFYIQLGMIVGFLICYFIWYRSGSDTKDMTKVVEDNIEASMTPIENNNLTPQKIMSDSFENDIDESIELAEGTEENGITPFELNGKDIRFVEQLFTIEWPETEYKIKTEKIQNEKVYMQDLITLRSGVYNSLFYYLGETYLLNPEKGIYTLPIGWFNGEQMAYNPYKEEVIIENGSYLHLVGEQEVIQEPIFDRSDFGFSDQLHLTNTLSFFSDGMMLWDNMLISTESWKLLGYVPTDKPMVIINDEIYTIGDKIEKIDFQGNVLESYEFIDGESSVWKIKDEFNEVSIREFYCDSKAIYFEYDNKFYYFDGKEYGLYLDPTGFKYFTSIKCDNLCVSDRGIYCFDQNTYTLYEFRRIAE